LITLRPRKKILEILAAIGRDERDPARVHEVSPAVRVRRGTANTGRRDEVIRWEPQLLDVLETGVPVAGTDRSGGTARDAFVRGIVSRVGGTYCTPPRKGCTDCSGLVAEEYRKATGRIITGSSYHLSDICTPIKPSEARAGDLVFHHTFGGKVNGNFDSHVGVIINDFERVDAMNETDGIKRGPRNRPYWYNTFTRAGRLPF
jgi:hypothetical protein